MPTPDGDHLELAWCGRGSGPIVMLLHGLTGSARSGYLCSLQYELEKLGWRSVAVNFRGCGERQNNTARCYHSGETGDFQHLYEQITQREPETPLAAVGVSLGGNVLLKWLGESSATARLFAACAVSVPYRLDRCATRMDRGFSRIYRDRLLSELKRYIAAKRTHLTRIGNHAEARRLSELGDSSPIRSFWDYDDRVIAKLYGFRDAHDYYATCSSRRYLRSIEVPTLLIHADDDPFMTADTVPTAEELAPAIRLELTRGGGHVGFVSGALPGIGRYWLDRRIPTFLYSRWQETCASERRKA